MCYIHTFSPKGCRVRNMLYITYSRTLTIIDLKMIEMVDLEHVGGNNLL